MLPHPTNPDILYIGSVNGGVWKTTNATSANPVWHPLTDSMPSLSIGALAFDYSDSKYNTIVAGIGSQSSDGRLGGLHMGVLRTTDGGETWKLLGTDDLYGYRIAGVHAYGTTITVCAVGYGLLSTQLYQNGATFYSKDTGETWKQVNSESCTDMQATSTQPWTVFRASLQSGIVVSHDSGASWSAGLLPDFPSRFVDTIRNIRISVRNIGTAEKPSFMIYAGFLARTLQGLFRGVPAPNTDNYTWTKLDAPVTNDNGTFNGLNPEFENNPGEGGNADGGRYYKPGGQGTIHFSIVSDANDPFVVYVGGDRQPTGGNATNPSWPNGIGAYNYDGRLFRCNASLETGKQCTPLTHMFAGNNSAPHADSRHMMFDAQGRIIEADDGGVFTRTIPSTTTGQWYSMNGNLQVQEAQGVAYVGNGIFVTGNQDTGTTFGIGGGSKPWNSLGQGDGAVPRAGINADKSRVVYWSYPFFGGFSATTFSAQGEVTTTVEPALNIAGTPNSLQNWVSGPAPPVSFYQDYQVNSVDAKRLLFTFTLDKFVYESFDGGETLQPIVIPGAPAAQQGNGAAVYGGIYRGTASANAGYLAGANLLAARGAAAGANWTMTNYPPIDMRWPTIAHVAAHPRNIEFVAVLGLYGEVAYSKDFGKTWAVLPPLVTGVFGMPDSMQRRIAIIPGGESDRFVVAGRTGVYVYYDSQSKWWRVPFPNAFVNDMAYDPHDDLLYVSTLGRSVWSVPRTSTVFTKYAFSHSRLPAGYVRPPKIPNWQTLTYVFAALTVVLFLAALVFAVAFLTTKLRDAPADEDPLLAHDEHA